MVFECVLTLGRVKIKIFLRWCFVIKVWFFLCSLFSALSRFCRFRLYWKGANSKKRTRKLTSPSSLHKKNKRNLLLHRFAFEQLAPSLLFRGCSSTFTQSLLSPLSLAHSALLSEWGGLRFRIFVGFLRALRGVLQKSQPPYHPLGTHWDSRTDSEEWRLTTCPNFSGRRAP